MTEKDKILAAVTAAAGMVREGCSGSEEEFANAIKIAFAKNLPMWQIFAAIDAAKSGLR